MFKDIPEGQTHYFGDGCNDPHGKCTCDIEDAPYDIGHFKGCPSLGKHTFLDRGDNVCKYGVGYAGLCGCKRDNEIHFPATAIKQVSPTSKAEGE